MKKMFTVAVATLISLSIVGVSCANEQVLVTRGATEKPSVLKERLVSVTATVTAVDATSRIVTLKGPKGKIFDVKAGEEVRNLAQVKVGDKVKVKYYQSVAVEVVAPGTAPGGVQEGVVGGRSKPGERPAGLIGGQVTVTATVEAIDKKNQTATLKGPEGKTLTVKVEDPRNLVNVKVGDEVVITLTEALAISVVGLKK
jgi:hypothetical protein